MRGMAQQELGVAQFDRPAAPDLAHHARHRRRAAAAAPDLAGMLGVDAVERQRKPVGVAFAADLAIRDDVDPGPLHVADREDRRVVLRLFEPRLGDAPDVARGDARHTVTFEHRAVHQPIPLRIAADDRCRDRMRRIVHSGLTERWVPGPGSRAGSADRSAPEPPVAAIARAWSGLTCRPVNGVGAIACDPEGAVGDSSKGLVATLTPCLTVSSVACATSQTKPSRWQARITSAPNSVRP